MILNSDPDILNGRAKEWRKKSKEYHLDNENISSADESKNGKGTHFEKGNIFFADEMKNEEGKGGIY